MAVYKAVVELHKLQQVISQRRKVLALVADQCITLAQASRLHGSCVGAVPAVQDALERADAVRDAISQRFARAKALQDRLAQLPAGGSTSDGYGLEGAQAATTLQASTTELQSILRDLNVRCRADIAGVDGRVETLELAVETASAQAEEVLGTWQAGGAAQLRTIEEVTAYAAAVEERIYFVRAEQEGSRLALSTVLGAALSQQAQAGAQMPVYEREASPPPTSAYKSMGARPNRASRAGLPMSPR
jgi:hypothetical protein